MEARPQALCFRAVPFFGSLHRFIREPYFNSAPNGRYIPVESCDYLPQMDT